MKELLVHTGTFKTGSTLLQTFLAQNRTRLDGAGISYKVRENYGDHTGNASDLVQGMLNRSLSREYVARIVLESFGGKNASILSSEAFTFFSDAEWGAIRDICDSHDINVKILIYIRNVYPYYMSSYIQAFKSGLFPGSFVEYVKEDHYSIIYHSLLSMSRIFGNNYLTVKLFDEVQYRLLEDFIGELRIDIRQFDTSLQNRRINRSLVTFEMNRFQNLKNAASQLELDEITSLLMNKRQDLVEKSTVQKSHVLNLQKKFVNEIAWINRTLFAGCDKLGVVGREEPRLAKANLTSADKLSIDEDIILWMAEKIRTAREDLIGHLERKVQNLNCTGGRDYDLPEEFDPLLYMLKNVDVLYSDLDPSFHYVNWGRDEGRPLR